MKTYWDQNPIPPVLAGACFRCKLMAASISVSVALGFHLFTAAGKKTPVQGLVRVRSLTGQNTPSVWLSGRRQSHHPAPQPQGLTGGYIKSI